MRSGLGNRLSLVLSSQAVADAEGRTFYYHWPVGGEGEMRQFGARFDELWDYTGGISIDEPGPTPMLEFFSERGYGDLGPVRNNPVISLTGNAPIPPVGASRDWTDILADLNPTEEVRALSDGPLQELGQRFIGVQVRAHPTLTHRVTLTASPVEWFIGRMQEIRREKPDIAFYLSSDSSAATEQIKAAVPGVISMPKRGEYNSRLGLIESVADLVVLSKSKLILAPYASSFAKIAWNMAGQRMLLRTSRRTFRAKKRSSLRSPQSR